MDIIDIAAEKIRALNERPKPRDLYDLYLVGKYFDLDTKEAIDLLRKKEMFLPLTKERTSDNCEVITVPYTFIASSFCIVQAGAIPVFADVRREDHCIDPEDIEGKITPRTRAIIPVHLYGNVCEMDEIMVIAKKHGLYVIEDAAEAHGALYKGKKVGSIGDVGAFSFCQNKTFTTGGEGGMVVTNNEEIAWEARSFRDHGYDVEKRMSLLEMEQALPYIHRRIGFNYRMTEMQSAIGLKELERIDTWNLPRRRRYGEILIDELSDCPQIKHLPVHNKEKLRGTVGQDSSGYMIGRIEKEATEYQAAQRREEVKEEEIPVKSVNIYKAEIEDFSGSILEDKALSFPPQLGLRNLKIALTAYESAKKGKPLRL